MIKREHIKVLSCAIIELQEKVAELEDGAKFLDQALIFEFVSSS